MKNGDFIELKPGDDGDQFEYKETDEVKSKPIAPWKVKLIFWSPCSPHCRLSLFGMTAALLTDTLDHLWHGDVGQARLAAPAAADA